MKFFKFISIVLVLFGVPVTVHAAEESMPYTVNLIPSDNQTEQANYFGLEVIPDENLELQVEILNHSEAPLTVKATVNDGLTAEGGFITYSGSGERGETMTHPFSELAIIEDGTIEVEPNSSEIASFEVKVPDESFDGVILGGLHFVNEASELEEEGLQIENLYAYEIAVQMREVDNDTKVNPEFGWHGASATLHNHREVVMTGISNDASIVAGDTEVKAEISKDGEVLMEDGIEDATFAPDSKMEWPIYTSEADLNAGDYNLEVTVVRGSDEWIFEDTFTITEEDRETIDEEAIVDKDDEEDTNWLVIGLIALVTVLLAALVYMFVKMRKQGRH